MPIVNRIAEFASDMTAWRRHLHTIPELAFDCPKTAAFIAERLREIGVDEMHEGIAETGIVAIINGQGDGPTIGLRADFDGLPIIEATGLEYASTHEGKMHACGHDGHTTMLLAMPHETCDPVIAACGVAQAIQTIVSRNHYALDDLVVSVTQIHTGTVDNVIPDTAYLNGTVRTFDPEVQDMVERRLTEIVAGQAASYGVSAELRYERGYPATINHAKEAAHAAEVAIEISGTDKVVADAGREMGAEDFAYMLEKRPGAYLFLGQGESAGLHHPEYNFNDDAIPAGCSWWAEIVEKRMPA